MRIVAGSLKGRRLEAREGRELRPSSDRTREGLFNRLVHGGWGPAGVSILHDAIVLDAFCGTGALGLEALSRGAAEATFLDSEPAALDVARRNSRRLEVIDRCMFTRTDAAAPPAAPRAHSLVFLDPPYSSALAAPALLALAGRGWIADGALCAVETAAKAQPPEPPEGFETVDEARYGAARVSLMRHTGER